MPDRFCCWCCLSLQFASALCANTDTHTHTQPSSQLTGTTNGTAMVVVVVFSNYTAPFISIWLHCCYFQFRRGNCFSPSFSFLSVLCPFTACQFGWFCWFPFSSFRHRHWHWYTLAQTPTDHLQISAERDYCLPTFCCRLCFSSSSYCHFLLLLMLMLVDSLWLPPTQIINSSLCGTLFT